MGGEWQDGVSIHCCLSLALGEDIMQGNEAGGYAEKEGGGWGVVRKSSRTGFPFFLHSPSP